MTNYSLCCPQMKRAFLWSSPPPVWAVNSNLTGTRLSLTRFFQPGTDVVCRPGRERGGRHPRGHKPPSRKSRAHGSERLWGNLPRRRFEFRNEGDGKRKSL